MLDKMRKLECCLIVCIAALLVAGCATSYAPKGWLDKVGERPYSGYGGWIKFTMESDSSKTMVEAGELIAISGDSLFWFDARTLKGVAKSRLKKLQLETYKSESGKLSSWTLLGTLSSASHGVLAVASAPLWILVGTSATAAASNEPVERGSEEEIALSGEEFWKKIRVGARFPAGFPERLDRSTLTPKPAMQ